ncbi:MAG: hypothetical protein ABIN55_10495 [Aeromicrobium sp.]
MERLASQWKLIALITAVAGAAIFAFYPDYNTLQMSNDANDFASILGDDESRARAANLSDLVFALGYGVLGVIAFRRLATGKVALIGALLAAGGALADEIENVLVFLNLRSDSPTNSDVDLMTTFGLIKWVLLIAAIALLIVVVIRGKARKS